MFENKVPTGGAVRGCIYALIILAAIAAAIAAAVYASTLPPWYLGGW